MRSIFLLLCCLFIYLFAHFFGYFGHFGFDDMDYALLASNYLKGDGGLQTEHFAYRWALVVPLSVSYFLFGISDFSSALPALAASLLTVAGILYALRQYGFLTLSVGVALFTLNKWSLFYADKIMTDVFVALAFLMAFLVLFRFRINKKGASPLLHAAALVTALFFGFVAKETIWFIVPTLVLLFLLDIKNGQHLKFWLASVAFGCLSLLAYFGFIFWQTGNVWERFAQISSNEYLNPCSYHLLPIEHLLKRITYGLAFIFIDTTFVLPLLFAVPALFQAKFSSFFKLQNQQSYWTFVAFSCLLSAYFLPISFTHYIPLCPDIRHYLFLTPLFSIAAAPFLTPIFQTKQSKRALFFSASLLSFVLISYFNGFDILTYLLMSFLFFTYSVLPFSSFSWIKKSLPFLFFAILSIEPAQSFLYARSVGYNAQKVAVKAFFEQQEKKAVVFTNPVQAHLGHYYFSFETEKLTFIDFRNAPSALPIDSSGNTLYYVLINGRTRHMSGIPWELIPPIARQLDEHFLQAEEVGIQIYQVTALEKLTLENLNRPTQ